ncbi:unnamed protein product [Lactuca saligna]|uniref:Reverse transcriptase zinc-binding domain-containing protein n=1 Tax=Lactuca saligna TaxID=75948 RepID=A0AA36EI97_LACSI|nr:unnamed protein product [Lactuca saligna]
MVSLGNIVKPILELESLDVGFDQILSCIVGFANNTLLWLDNWTSGGTFVSCFPHLSNFDSLKSCLVAYHISQYGVKWIWKHRLEQQHEDSKNLPNSAPFSITSSSQTQHIRRSLTFPHMVSSMLAISSELFDYKVTCSVNNPTVWLKLVQIKTTSIIWRSCMDHIPTVFALTRRGVNLGTTACHFCPTGTESTEHLLVGYVYVREVLSWVLK